MDLLILGSLLLTGGLLSLAGVFDGGDDKDDNPPDARHHGTSGDDALSGDQGILSGWGGADILHLSGTAEGHGNQGDDTLTATDHSTAYGGVGNDDLNIFDTAVGYGGENGDHMTVEDTATGYGDSGNDWMNGANETQLFGGIGDDSIYGGTVHGDDGNDSLSGTDSVYGGAGNDDIELNHVTGDSFGHAAYGGTGNDDLTGLGLLYGGAGSDTVSGFYNAVADGGSGNDLLIGYSDSATLFGGAGNDFIYDYSGGTIYGGEGDDMFMVGHAPNAASPLTVLTDFDPAHDKLAFQYNEESPLTWQIHIDAGAGYTDVIFQDANDAVVQITRLMGVTEVTEDAVGPVVIGDDFFYHNANPEILTPLIGTSDADLITAQSHATDADLGDGDDTMIGGSGADVVHLDGGNDVFISSGNTHIVFGGAGDDSYIGHSDASGDHGKVDLGEGNDTFLIASGQQDLWIGQEGFFGGTGDDVFTVQQGANASIVGGEGNDSISADSGGSIVTLGAGDDTVSLHISSDWNVGDHLYVNDLDGTTDGGQDQLIVNIDANVPGVVSFTHTDSLGEDNIYSTRISILIDGHVVANAYLTDQRGVTAEDLIANGSLQVNRV